MEQVAQASMGLDPMPQGPISVDLVMIAPALPMALEVAGFLQIGDDPLHGAFGDPDLQGNLPQ